MILLTKILNCCHLLAKLILPSIRSGLPIWTKVRSWVRDCELKFTFTAKKLEWHFVGGIEKRWDLLGEQGQYRGCMVVLPPQVPACQYESWFEINYVSTNHSFFPAQVNLYALKEEDESMREQYSASPSVIVFCHSVEIQYCEHCVEWKWKKKKLPTKAPNWCWV